MALFGDLPPPASDNNISLFDDLPPEINSSDKAEDLVDSRVNKRPSTGAEEVEDSCSKRSKREGKLHTQVRQATSVGQGGGGECRHANMAIVSRERLTLAPTHRPLLLGRLLMQIYRDRVWCLLCAAWNPGTGSV